MIPEGFITGLLERADIVDVINRYVPLKKAGRNFTCCGCWKAYGDPKIGRAHV